MNRFVFTLLLACAAVPATAAVGVVRSRYLDMMAQAVSAYTDGHIDAYADRVEHDGLREHGFPRLAANIGILLAHGRAERHKDRYRRMMELCCREFPVSRAHSAKEGPHHRTGNEFSVKEIVLSLLEIEKAGVFAKDVTDRWRTALGGLKATEVYSCLPTPGEDQAQNWVLYGCASEQVRLYAGLGGEASFVEKYVSDQMRFFDENGMYRDPHEPLVYDLVTRLQLAVVLFCGYDGPSRAKLEEHLLKSAEATLLMQSATGEIPFGGRSQQQLHNEMFYCALCEFYASWFKRRGDLARAGRFRLAAARSADVFSRYASRVPCSHVKNRYSRGDASQAAWGCESYAYFDKYMVTAASWAYLAYLMADDTIPAAEETGAEESVFATSGAFHQVFLNAGDYTVQLDMAADPEYDASGIGRVVRRGAPTPLCIGVPVSERPNYVLGRKNPTPLALAPGHKLAGGRWKYAFGDGYRIDGLSVSNGMAQGTVLVDGMLWDLKLGRCGFRSELRGEGELALVLPAFLSDGSVTSVVERTSHVLTIAYEGYLCRYVTDGGIVDSGLEYGNRNGRYRRYEARGVGRLAVGVEIVDPKEVVLALDQDRLVTSEIQQAIDAVSARGGGLVTLPAGVYTTGSLLLKDNVTLKLERGCVLQGSTNYQDYVQFSSLVPDVKEHLVVSNAQSGLKQIRAIVGAVGVRNAGIRGEGRIDGRGGVTFRSGKSDMALNRWRDVAFFRCRDVRVEDVTLTDPATWTMFFRECEDVVVRGLCISSHANYNNDGIDVEAKGALIENCWIDSDDDAVCLKSHNPDYVVENVEVRNCRVSSNCNFLKCGTAGYGGFKNVWIHDCVLAPCTQTIRPWNEDEFIGGVGGVTDPITGLAGIALEVVDGGRMEGIRVSNIDMSAGGVQTPLLVRLGKRHIRPDGSPAVLRDVIIENVKGRTASWIASSITGVPGLRPQNIVIRNVDLTLKAGKGLAIPVDDVPEVEDAYPENRMFSSILPACGFYLRHCDGVVFKDVRLRVDAAVEKRQPIVAEDCTKLSWGCDGG